MQEFFTEDIQQLNKLVRASFINSLGGFKSLVLVGTRNSNKQENLAPFSSLFHIGANPALCGLIVRPDEVPRHTLSNILETQEYTVNHVNEGMYFKAHQSSARYASEDSEFESVELSPEYKHGIMAPFVKESAVQFACKLEQKIDLEINGTILIIGKIIYVNIPDNSLCADGFIDIEAAGTLTLSGLDSYHSTTRLARLSYAKPGSWPKEI